MPQVCFDTTAFYPFMFINIMVIVFALYTVIKYDTQPRSHRSRPSQPVIWRDQPSEDLTRMLHPMAPPLKRNFYDINPFRSWNVGVPINIPTRGEYDNFQQLGFLFNDAEKAMALMGRRIHSNQYEYYTFHHKNPQLKIPIAKTKEINDGEAVTLPGYTGAFTVKMYDNDYPRYMP